MDEFELIRHYFDRRRSQSGVQTDIGDDGAVLRPNPDLDQIQVIDTLVEVVHFPKTIDPSDIAYRAVAVNLSDIAAMGARPRWMTLALTIPDTNKRWLDAFATGLFSAADEFDVALVGGDTTKGRPVELAILLIGVYELESRPDVPFRVVINECVNLAKRFGSTDGHKYINACLDVAAKSFRESEIQAQG